MPIKNARYVTIKKGGKTIRLAFVNGEVVEAKNTVTGKTHTPAEFKADKAKKKRKGKKK
jgi:hypothetical protein